jgi:hypothetical protein
MLIARQKPNATQVCGFRAWRELGRFVKRGEKGILILAPMIGYCRPHKNEIKADEIHHEESSQALIGFRPVYVFDITQTDGKELPSFIQVKGDGGPYTEDLRAFIEANAIRLVYSESIAPAKGISEGGTITLLLGMQAAEEFATLVHEIGHEMLHRGERRTQTTRRVRETEAEAVAFCCLPRPWTSCFPAPQ